MIKIYIWHSFEHLQLTEHVTKQTKTFSQCFLVNSRVLIKQSLAMCSVWHFEIIKAKTQAWWTKFYSGAQIQNMIVLLITWAKQPVTLWIPQCISTSLSEMRCQMGVLFPLDIVGLNMLHTPSLWRRCHQNISVISRLLFFISVSLGKKANDWWKWGQSSEQHIHVHHKWSKMALIESTWFIKHQHLYYIILLIVTFWSGDPL